MGVFVTFHFQTLWLHIQGLLAKLDTHMLLAGEHNGSPKFINNNPAHSLDFPPGIFWAPGSEHHQPQTCISSTGRNREALLLCKNGKLRQKCVRHCQDSQCPTKRKLKMMGNPHEWHSGLTDTRKSRPPQAPCVW